MASVVKDEPIPSGPYRETASLRGSLSPSGCFKRNGVEREGCWRCRSEYVL